jgi:hypothetical protein
MARKGRLEPACAFNAQSLRGFKVPAQALNSFGQEIAIYWFAKLLDPKFSRYRESTKRSNRRDARDVASAFRTALIKGEVGIVERKRLPNFGDAPS